MTLILMFLIPESLRRISITTHQNGKLGAEEIPGFRGLPGTEQAQQLDGQMPLARYLRQAA